MVCLNCCGFALGFVALCARGVVVCVVNCLLRGLRWLVILLLIWL